MSETGTNEPTTNSPVQPDAPSLTIKGEPFMVVALDGGGYVLIRWLNGKPKYWGKSSLEEAAAQFNGWLMPTPPVPAPTVSTP